LTFNNDAVHVLSYQNNIYVAETFEMSKTAMILVPV